MVNEMYCNTLCLQLAHKQTKAEGSKGKETLVSDGLPRLLSGGE
jgi:hypothetical protein